MRIFVCVTLLFICLATLPTVHSQNRKYKLAEYSETDKKDTKERYSKRALEPKDDSQRHNKKLKYRGKNDNTEEITEKRFKKKELKFKNQNNEDYYQYDKPSRKTKRNEADDEVQEIRKYKKYTGNNEHNSKKYHPNAKKPQDSDEDDDTDKDNGSEVCSNRKGQNCESDEDDSEESGETEEDKQDISKKKRVTYLKKFAHEKKNTKQDQEFHNILKIHKKSALDIDKKANNRKYRDDEDDSSEEIAIPKLHRFVYEDDDE